MAKLTVNLPPDVIRVLNGLAFLKQTTVDGLIIEALHEHAFSATVSLRIADDGTGPEPDEPDEHDPLVGE